MDLETLTTATILQELLPDHVVMKEGKSTTDKGKGPAKQWHFGWGKKKGDKEQDPLPTLDAEVLKVSLELGCRHRLHKVRC